MKKKHFKYLCFGVFVTATTTGTAQVISQKVGTNPTVINASAVLELESTTKGLLLPRMTTGQRTGIGTPASGLQVYDTTTNSVWYYNGSAWVNTAAATGWNLTGNAGTAPDTNFIGTTDAQDLVLRTNNTEKARVLSNGYVGIGTTAPASLLDVNGDAAINGIRVGNGGAGVTNTVMSNPGPSSFAGTDNTVVGYYGLWTNSVGSKNTAIGSKALYSNGGGNQNTGIGVNAGREYNATGNGNNTFVGFDSGRYIQTGTGNTMLGANISMGASGTSVSNNTIVGVNFSNTGGTISNSTILGANVAVTTAFSNNIILADGSGNRRINVDATGNVGINTSTPVSRLEVSGAIGLPIATATANITLDNTHAVVRVDATAGDVTVTLPLASTVINRIYSIIKQDSSANAITFSSTIQGNGFTFTTVNIAGEYKIQSNGTNWVLVN